MKKYKSIIKDVYKTLHDYEYETTWNKVEITKQLDRPDGGVVASVVKDQTSSAVNGVKSTSITPVVIVTVYTSSYSKLASGVNI